MFLSLLSGVVRKLYHAEMTFSDPILKNLQREKFLVFGLVTNSTSNLPPKS